jgi:hypothetical protein
MEPKIRIKIIQIVLLFSFCGIITEKVFSQPTPPPSGPDFGSSTPITIFTPKNESINATTYTDVSDWVTYWEALGTWYVTSNGWDATREGPATHEYNCHGYAWHVSENSPHCWINYNELSKYWTGLQSYVQVSTNAIGRKIRFTNDDHSAITAPSGYVRSKWARLPLYRHLINHCPYISTGLSYYELFPNLTGSVNLLCLNGQRSFNTNITNMSGATFSWTPGPFITEVSGSGTSQYTIKGIGNGYSSVGLQINTPSGFSWLDTKYFYAGKPVLSNQKVDGYNYYTGYQICPGNHWLAVTVTGEGASNTAWTVPQGIAYFVGYNELDFTFPFSWSSIAFSATSTNGCGTTSNTSYYLTKKTYGCPYGMTLSPNPASDYVTITIEQDQRILGGIADTSNIYLKSIENSGGTYENHKIKIYNSQSSLVSSYTRGGNKFDIQLRNLNDGLYIIEVTDGLNIYRQQLIVKRN